MGCCETKGDKEIQRKNLFMINADEHFEKDLFFEATTSEKSFSMTKDSSLVNSGNITKCKTVKNIIREDIRRIY